MLTKLCTWPSFAEAAEGEDGKKCAPDFSASWRIRRVKAYPPSHTVAFFDLRSFNEGGGEGVPCTPAAHYARAGRGVTAPTNLPRLHLPDNFFIT